MQKINLKSSEATTAAPKNKGGAKVLAAGLLALAVSIGCYAYVEFTKRSIIAQIEETQAQIDTKKRELNSKDFAAVYDFQGRLLDLKELTDGKVKQYEVLDKIAKQTLSKTQFTKIEQEYEGRKVGIEASILCPNYEDLSKQLEAFDMDDDINNVILDSSESKGNKLEANISFVVEIPQKEEKSSAAAVTKNGVTNNIKTQTNEP